MEDRKWGGGAGGEKRKRSPQNTAPGVGGRQQQVVLAALPHVTGTQRRLWCLATARRRFRCWWYDFVWKTAFC